MKGKRQNDNDETKTLHLKAIEDYIIITPNGRHFLPSSSIVEGVVIVRVMVVQRLYYTYFPRSLRETSLRVTGDDNIHLAEHPKSSSRAFRITLQNIFNG